MDTLGDAYAYEDEDDYGDEPAPRSQVRSNLTAPESLAVASLALACCAFFAGGLFQYLSFVIGSSLADRKAQYLLFAAPTACLAGLAVALGLTAARREANARWVVGMAGGGVLVGTVGFVATVTGMILAAALGESGSDVTF